MVIAAGILTIREALKVIHLAVNSNMTRALDEVTQLHKDVTELIQERNLLRVEAGEAKATEKLAGRLIVVVDDIAEQQKVVASDLVKAQSAVDEVASDLATAQGVVDTVASTLADSERRADEVPSDEPPGAAADAASRPPQG